MKWVNEDWQKHVCFLFWRYENKDVAILLGNLETGITGSSQFAVKGALNFQQSGKCGCHEKVNFVPGYIKAMETGIYIANAPHKACIVLLKKQIAC